MWSSWCNEKWCYSWWVDKNLCYDWLLGDRKAVDEAFAKADKIIKVDLINNRLVPNAMEPRACVVDYNTASEEILYILQVKILTYQD